MSVYFFEKDFFFFEKGEWVCTTVLQSSDARTIKCLFSSECVCAHKICQSENSPLDCNAYHHCTNVLNLSQESGEELIENFIANSSKVCPPGGNT